MSDHAQTAQPPVDPEALKKAIQNKLKDRRHKSPFTDFSADRPVFSDGVWRSIVHDNKKDKRAEDYATILSEVEEEIFDDFGVNVALVLACD